MAQEKAKLEGPGTEYEFKIEQALSDIVKIKIESNKGFYNKQELSRADTKDDVIQE